MEASGYFACSRACFTLSFFSIQAAAQYQLRHEQVVALFVGNSSVANTPTHAACESVFLSIVLPNRQMHDHSTVHHRPLTHRVLGL